MREAMRVPGVRRMVGVGLVVALVVLGAVTAPCADSRSARAEGVDEGGSVMPVDEVRSEREELTELTVGGRWFA